MAATAHRTVPAGLDVRVRDDGDHPARLSENARSGGYGLAGMAERAEAPGGSLTAGPAPEGGRLVTATPPFQALAAGPAGPSVPAGRRHAPAGRLTRRGAEEPAASATYSREP
ncbi:hypothetical protein ACIRO3_22535 [Streptomyces sp. NPDC102278]|uniref:hypothetical protein n=1 Tax=Streptomyces sp. NPDC102278 TaxID=3366152 RepID=UPI00380BA9E2